MTITIPNADNSLIKVIQSLNEKLSVPYEIINEDELYTDECMQNIQESEKEFEAQLKNGTLKTFKNAKEAFKDAGLL